MRGIGGWAMLFLKRSKESMRQSLDRAFRSGAPERVCLVPTSLVGNAMADHPVQIENIFQTLALRSPKNGFL
ncbi:MAG: hypothetical protein CL666_05705 [Balneola sp.]|nr:hypothetical protein [Balneola sp.]